MRAGLWVLLAGATAFAGGQMPDKVKNDPCLNDCAKQMANSARSCHTKSCFPPLFQAFNDCSLKCTEQRHKAQDREPMCKGPRGKDVPCSELHPKKPEQ
jgi:hypothetical protein